MFGPPSRQQLIGLLFAAGCFTVLIIAGGNVSVAHAHQKALRQYSTKISVCMPADVRTDEVAVYDGRKNITVAERLKSMNARCNRNRLVGRNQKEIRFFRRACYGYPPPNYLELQAEQSRKLEELKAKYIVVVIGCDPRIP